MLNDSVVSNEMEMLGLFLNMKFFVQGDSLVASCLQHSDAMWLLCLPGGRRGARSRRALGTSLGLPRPLRGASLAPGHGFLHGLWSNVHQSMARSSTHDETKSGTKDRF